MTAAPANEQLKIACPGCQRHFDVTDMEPFVRFECPDCGQKVVVPQWWRSYLFEECVSHHDGVACFRALDTELDREVLVEQVRMSEGRSESECTRYLEVIRQLAQSPDASMCAVYSCGRYEDGVYSVVQYVREEMPAQNWTSVQQWLPLVLKLLAQLSSQSLYHGALSRACFRRAENGKVSVCGFGLGMALSGWGASGTNASPERLLGGEASMAGDIYSLGCVLWECLGGSLSEGGDLGNDVPKHVVELLRQMMSAQVMMRPKDYQELYKGFAAAQSADGQAGKEEKRGKKLRVSGGGRPAVPIQPVPQSGGIGVMNFLLIVLVLCALGLGGWLYWQRQQPAAPPAPVPQQPVVTPVPVSAPTVAAVDEELEEDEPETASQAAPQVSVKDSWEPLSEELRKQRPRPKDVRLTRSKAVKEFIAQLPENQRKGVQWQAQHITEMLEIVSMFALKNRYDRGAKTVLELRNGKKLRAVVTMCHPKKGLHLQPLKEGDKVPDYVKVSDLSWKTIRDMTDYIAAYSADRLDSKHPDYQTMKRETVRHYIRLTLLCDWYGDEKGVARYRQQCLALEPGSAKMLQRLGLAGDAK